MSKRVIIISVIGLIIILGVYIYLGMFWAEKTNEVNEEVNDASLMQDEELLERLQDAGTMSEEGRQEMLNRLENAQF